MENGVSKKDRAEFLKKQREERKANRKKGASTGIRTRRASTPTMMPSTVDVIPGPIATSVPATPPSEAQRPSVAEPVQVPPMPTESNKQAPTGILPKGEHGEVATDPPLAQTDSTSEAIAPPAAPVRPPPTFFNPTNVPPPPVGPPSTAASARAQPPRHPSMAFNVDETVERALKEARQEAGVAERRAAFWKCRFRDLAVWSASFVVLAYASDHSFDLDC